MTKQNRPSLRLVLGSLAILACFASTAFAGTTGGYRKITLLQASASSDRVIMKFDASLSSRPSCVTAGNEDLMSFDAATARGKSHLALVQASFLANRLVSATGTGTCTGGIENLNWIGLAD
jgi:hypothetical protein